MTTKIVIALVLSLSAAEGRETATSAQPASRQAKLAGQSSQVVAATTLAPALSFEKAPTGSEAQFIARSRRSVMLKKTSAVLALNRKSPSTSQPAGQDVRIEFAGANREPAVFGEEQLPGMIYYASGDFLGPLTGNPTFARVRYVELYRGIDAVFYGNDREVEFDFQVAPHADASRIRLSLAGTDKITLEPSGDLSLLAGGEEVRLKKPVIYQQHDGTRTEIAGGFRLSRSHSEVRFEVGPYDHNLPLIIDPAVLFATYVGGAGNEFLVQVGANSSGEVYLMGKSSQSSTLPPHQTFTIGTLPSLQCFLTKLSADGTTALYTVLFAGADCGTMEVANNGKVHVSVNSGTAAGTVRTLVESTMSLGPLQGSYTIGLGTYQSFSVSAMRVDSAGNLYLIVTFGSSSGLVYELQKVNPQGQLLGKIQLLFAPVYADNSIPDQVGGGLPGALDVDDAGHAYVVGLVKTPGAITPTANAFHSTMLVKQAPNTDSRSDFLMRVDTTTANAFRIDYATFFGGSQDDPVSAVAFDRSSNDVVVVGATNSPDFPTTPGTFAPSHGVLDYHPYEGFLIKFDLSQPAAQQLIYGTFLNPSSFVYSLTILPGGLPVIAGDATDSPVFANPFPLVNSLYPPQFTSKNRQFLSVFSPDARSLMFSTFLDSAPASQSFWPLLANNGLHTVYEATTTNFPGLSTSSGFQSSIAGGLDLFVRALDGSDLIAAASSRADLSLTATASPAPVNVGSVLTYSIAVTNLGPQAASAIAFTFGLPANVTFQSVTPGQGSCQTPAVGATGTITCSLGTIANGAAVPLSVSVTAQATGPAIASPKVASITPDPNFANNTLNLETTVGTSTQYQLTTAHSGSGSGTVTVVPSGVSCGGNCMAYNAGTTVTLTATPDTGSSFTGFTGGGCGSANPCSFTITASTTVTVAFTLNPVQLTTASSGTGSGSVTVSPSGISCGVNCMTYNPGTTVTVTATPNTGSSFTGFTGGGCGSINPCSFMIGASTAVTAAFTLNQYTLTTQVVSGSGTVTAVPSGVSCGANCMVYDYGTTVTVTATPSAGYSFLSFAGTGGGCGSTNPCSLTITTSNIVTATFILNRLTTATIGSGSGIVTVSPGGMSCGVDCMTYDSGTTVTVTATPSAGSSFIGFGFSGGGCSSTNPCSFTINAPTSITATFGLDLPPTGFEGYLYALVDVTNTGNKLYGFKVDSTGALTPLGSPFPLGIGDSGNGVFGTERLAYDKHHKRLYVVHDGFHYVSTHVMDLGSGILTLESGPSLLSGGNWDCAALHPGGSPLVVGAGSLGRLASFWEPGSDPSISTILGGGSFTGTARPFSCVFSQDGKFVYAGGNGGTNGGGPTIAGFSVNSTLHELVPVPGSPFDVGSSVAAPFATDSDGRLFAADVFGGLLRVFTTSGGVPTAVNGSPFSSGISNLPHAVLHPAGLYMLADFDGDRIGVYQVAGSGPGTTLTAVSGSPFPSGGTGPRVLALSDTGDFVFAANSTSHNIAAFRVDASGQLTSIGTQAPNALGTTGVVTGLTFVPIHLPVTSPPSIAKAFGASTIALGTNTTLTFTLDNPNSWYLSGVAFTDPLPAGMTVASANSARTSCGGTVTVAADLRSIALANGSIPASGTCTVSATITGKTVGTWTNVTGNITSSESGSGGNASATLTVGISLVSIRVMPANPTINTGSTLQFTATGTYSDSSTQNITGSVTWGSATPSVATITAGGLATGVGAGPSLITATSGSISGSTTLTVSNPYSPPPPNCCTTTGPYVDPAHGVNIDISKDGMSPSGKYQVTASGIGAPAGFANITVKRGTQVVLTAQTAFWGFSPDDDRFVTHFVQDPGGASIDQVTLYDLTSATPQNPIWTSSDSTHSSRIQFSPSGRYLFYTDVVSGPQTHLTLIDAHTGTPEFSDSIQPFPGAPIEGEDSFGTVNWGFGPNDSRFVYGYLSAQTNVEWNLVNLEKGPFNARVNGISLLGEIADYWQFSPCGEVIGLVHQLGQRGVRVEIYNTKDGTPAGLGAEIPSPIQVLQLHTTSTSHVATNTTASGSSDSTLGANIPPCTASFTLHSPANILLVDEHGRRTGFDAATGVVVNEIPGGSYTGIGSEPQTITVPYVAGTYVIHVYGLDSLTSPEPYRLTIATSDSSNAIDLHEIAGMATSGSRQQFVFVLDDDGLITPLSGDTTPPAIACASPDGQWHASDVSLACTAGDSPSGLANAADASFLLTTHVAAGVETSAATDSRQVCDQAGNCATAGPVGGNKIDKKAPSVVITAPAGTYVLGQAVAASYSCTDGGSGVASCTGPVANGANIDTQTVGAKSFIVSSSDNVGNRSSAVASYNVAYSICPLYTVVAKQSGSTYPIKIQLCDANGNNVSASSIVVHAVSVTRVSATTPAALDDGGNANPDFDFRYDTTLNGYMFNLSTKGYAGGTYTLNFTAGNDAALYSAQFAVK